MADVIGVSPSRSRSRTRSPSMLAVSPVGSRQRAQLHIGWASRQSTPVPARKGSRVTGIGVVVSWCQQEHRVRESDPPGRGRFLSRPWCSGHADANTVACSNLQAHLEWRWSMPLAMHFARWMRPRRTSPLPSVFGDRYRVSRSRCRPWRSATMRVARRSWRAAPSHRRCFRGQRHRA